MSSNTLEKIITKKTEKIEKLKKTISSESLNDLIKANNTFVDFKEKIEENIFKIRANFDLIRRGV